jgi:hypothetical protein
LRRYPRRTLLLMALALLAFVRLYYISHSRPPSPAATPRARLATPAAPQQPACLTLDRTLEDVLHDPSSPPTLARARRELESCRTLPPRACELGSALDARAPLAQDAGEHPLRELLDTLCQRCPMGSNPCANAVVRTVMAVGVAGQPLTTDVRWHLEHAGSGSAEACAEVVRYLLAPVALDEGPPTEPRRQLLEQLGPLCARMGQLPSSILRAAAAQGDVAVRDWLAPEPPAAESSVLKPDRVVGSPAAPAAFDGQEATHVTLTRDEQAPGWRKEGAASATFEPPVRSLAAVRVKARGPGTLRAAVRVDEGLGLHDARTQASFLLPRLCHFRGTGQWEDCPLPVALQDVEALSVYPDKAPLELFELEARGTR